MSVPSVLQFRPYGISNLYEQSSVGIGIPRLLVLGMLGFSKYEKGRN
jgi:hypothetical protein